MKRRKKNGGNKYEESKQISVDILVDEEKDGCVLAEQIAKDLEVEGNIILGSSFQDDLTELYKRDYPELLKEE